MTFACPWLVGMSEKASGAVRTGCGRYEWAFRSALPRLAQRLTITIEVMQTLSPNHLDVVMDWLSALPYPWCPAQAALVGAPDVKGLSPLLDFIREATSS